MEQELWRDVVGYEGYYEINRQGSVRSLHKRNFHQIISSRKSRGQYYTVRLCKKGIKSTQYLHRLLALTFLENPESKPFVNHKNGNTFDNDLDNLEFVTHSENIKHAYSIGLFKIPFKSCKKVVDVCSNQEYSSIREAAEANNISYSTCKNLLRGIRKNRTCLRLKE